MVHSNAGCESAASESINTPSDAWKPAVMIWRWGDAPEEFRALSPFGGGEESVVYVPPELLDCEKDYDTATVALWFLSWKAKFPGHVKHAGEEWGEFSHNIIADGAVVVITAGSRCIMAHAIVGSGGH
jgi:hypothetical protein